MRAAVLHGPRDLRIEEVADPLPPPGWALIRTAAVGICGTDKAFYTGAYPLFKRPLIPGHEAAG
ncbi:MAG: alcohol dehydrogenase catalytic domain-containing protein, partial [Thermofilaceae archaeon]